MLYTILNIKLLKQRNLECSIVQTQIFANQLYIIIIRQNMSRRGNSQTKQFERADRMDPSREMHQMMRGFGGIRDDFFGGMMGFRGDPFQDMFKFSDIHKNMHSKGTQGSYVSQSFVSSSKMGPDGKIIREDYFQNSMGQRKGGKTISQKQQAYKNNSGVNRIAEERMLNDKGRKIVKQKNGNNIEETNHYYNIDQQDAHQFDTDWRSVNQEMKFLENHQKYLRGLGHQQPRHRQLGYEPNRPQRNQFRAVQHPRNENKSKKSSEIGSESRGSKRTETSKYSNTRKY